MVVHQEFPALKKILVIVGTRPNFIKITQFRQVAREYEDIDLRIVHTGQHSDHRMAQVFFDQFDFTPDYYLDVKSNDPASQMAEIIMKLAKLMRECRANLVLVVGDVNSTLAGALAAHKNQIPLGHIESGLRSRDPTMPEEHNRILTDQISDYFFITEQSGLENLQKEGKNENLFLVGNTMIDTMVTYQDRIEQSRVMAELKINSNSFCLMTIHRPATVDSKAGLQKLISLIQAIAADRLVVFPVHPRTTDRLKHYKLFESLVGVKDLIVTEPLDYFAFQKLIAGSSLVLTDSGGIQEETTFRKIPCLTLRKNTERPSTIELGTNQLIHFDTDKVISTIEEIDNGTFKKSTVPPLWDGKATHRILEIISQKFSG